jgi:glycosyltransferase involved in cell wall biosynthesis
MKFSIIIPYYNSHNYIEHALNSLNDQSCLDFEVVIIDDFSELSSYNSLEIAISNYTFPIRLYRQSRNLGPGRARKEGIKLACGDYILFLDSDDYFEPNALSVLSNFIETNVDIVLFDCFRITDNRKIRLNILKNLATESSKADYIALSFDSLWCMCIRRDILLKTNLPEIYNAEDTVSVPVILSAANIITHIDKALYNYTYRTNSLSTRFSNELIDGFLHAWAYLKNNSSEEYFEAFQFRLIKLVIYGITLNWLRIGSSLDGLLFNLNQFDKENPNWTSNKYISHLPMRKRLFIELVSHRKIALLKLYVKIQNLLIQI